MTESKDSTGGVRKLRLVTQDGAEVGIDDDGEPPADPPIAPVELDVGSDVEIAGCLELGEIHWCEGKLWFYGGTHWLPYPANLLRLATHRYDGALYTKPGRKNSDLVQLNKHRIDSILHEMAALLAAPDFFAAPALGINCRSGFLVIDKAGVEVLTHHPDHRARHLLPGNWSPEVSTPPENSLLARMLCGAFAGEDDAAAKRDLVAETAGSTALGIGTRVPRPKAVIFYGPTAENGKSAVLDMLRGLVPATAIASVPASKMNDVHFVVQLAGVLLNASDELSSAAVASDAFKKVVTGEPITARDVYRSAVTFRSQAQNIFATNVLPAFSGGIDRGVERRTLVLPFHRTIPENERVEAIGQRIALEEPDLLLGFAVCGARRLLAGQGFTVPPSSHQTLRDWLHSADPVRGWVWAQVTILPKELQDHWIATRSAYEQFVEWARAEGFRVDKLPAIKAFTQRVQSLVPTIEHKRSSVSPRFYGIRIGDKAEEECA